MSDPGRRADITEALHRGSDSDAAGPWRRRLSGETILLVAAFIVSAVASYFALTWYVEHLDDDARMRTENRRLSEQVAALDRVVKLAEEIDRSGGRLSEDGRKIARGGER